MLKRTTTVLLVVVAVVAFLAAAAFLATQIIKNDEEVNGTIETTSDTDDRTVPEYTEGDEEGTYWVTNPTTGSKLYVEVLTPRGPKSNLSALVLVPGGSGTSRDFLQEKKHARDIVSEGFVVVLFDPEGRGRSEGEEDNNGTIGQDGLYAVVEFAARLDNVDPARLGIASFSYGITMASGMLARYPDSSARYLVDWEGPSDRNETGACDDDATGHLQDIADCDDEAFWAEREALTFIAEIDVPYIRIQTEEDHVQPDNDHAVKMNNAAVNGDAPWVRVNDGEPNTFYTMVSLPVLPEAADRTLMAKVAEYAFEAMAEVQ